MPFIHDDFLLSNDTASALYHEHAKSQPIYDYHCHLPPADLAGNRSFGNLFEAWLEGDHYKWRAMRANGIDEAYCTGDVDPFDKFCAYAQTVPHTIRNPLYHWTHLELKRYFDIDLLLSPDTAKEIWDHANSQLASMNVKTILDRFNVALIGTTDDPVDTLEHHQALANNPIYDTAIYPAFRPDKAYNLTDTKAFGDYVKTLEQASQINCDTLKGFCDAIAQRHAFFHQVGSRLSDHGLTHLPVATCSESQACDIFKRAQQGSDIAPADQDKFTIYMMLFLGQLDADAGWTKQLHLGAMRNNNAWALKHLGPDTGFDSIGDYPQGQGLSAYLGTLAGREQMPKTILYNLNPADNYLFAAMIGNFQDGQAVGKIQYGSGWWFLDQQEGMTGQLNALSNLGLLTRFVGMLTDSRSFLSYPRHEYFRRLLCDMIGRDVASGALPGDMAMLGQVVENICFHNAKNYFGMNLTPRYA